jgi:hypothetical protein
MKNAGDILGRFFDKTRSARSIYTAIPEDGSKEVGESDPQAVLSRDGIFHKNYSKTTSLLIHIIVLVVGLGCVAVSFLFYMSISSELAKLRRHATRQSLVPECTIPGSYPVT